MIERYSISEIDNIFSEQSKFERYLQIEILLLEALEKLKKIPSGVSDKVKKLVKIDISEIKKIEAQTHHDIVAFVTHISNQAGKYARYIHWGLTSSDLIDTTLAWQIKEALKLVYKEIDKLLKEIKKKASEYKDTICIGRTHGVHAEPYIFGLKFLLFYDEVKRAYNHLKEIEKEVCCGKISGAVGTYAHIPPFIEKYICKKLGIYPADISTQIVSRDRFAYLISTFAILGSVYERFATEIRHLHRTEVKEAEEPFYKSQKGSSAMPHKKNPVVCERISGIARLLRGYTIVSMENIPLWHERDISHSSAERIIIPDAFHLIVYATRKVYSIIKDLKVYPENMKKNLSITNNIFFSQRLMLSLMDKGLDRITAYNIVQKLAFKSLELKKPFDEVVKDSDEVRKYLPEKELDKLFNLKEFLKNVKVIYKRFNI